jgi:HEAT repeat protein
MRFGHALLATLAALTLLTGQGRCGEKRSEGEELLAQLRRLEPGQSRDDRLGGLEWLQKHDLRGRAGMAIPAVERCLLKDPDPSVRARAAQALAHLALVRRPRVCPLALLKALEDREGKVREGAMTAALAFEEFAPGSPDQLVRCAADKDPSVRGFAVLTLAIAAPKDERALRVARAACADPHFSVRHDAHIAVYRITKKLEDIVPYCLRTQAEFVDEPPLPEGATAAEKQERARKNLQVIGAITHLFRLGDEHPAEVARLVIAQLDDTSPAARRGAANFVKGQVKWRLERPKYATFLTPSATAEALLPYVEDPLRPPAKKNQIKEKEKPPPDPPSKLEVRLVELGVAERLARLRDRDPVPAVRTAAREALEVLDSAKKKAP